MPLLPIATMRCREAKAKAKAWLPLLAFCLFAGRAAAADLTEAQVRAFADRQRAAWNRGDLGAYFATFRREATFTDQTRTGKGEIIRYGTSTLAQGRAQARKLFAASKVSETGAVERVILAPDGKSAKLLSRAETQIVGKTGTRRVCATREQTVNLSGGRILSDGRIDTIRRCRAGR